MKKLILLILVLVVSCSGPRVVYDYDKKVSFDDFKTYNFYPEMKTGLSQLDDKRLFFQVDSVLQSKGFTKSETPSFYINMVSEEFLNDNRSSIGIGLGGTGRSVGVGVSGGIPIGNPQTNREIVFDLIDVERNELMWQASAISVVREKTTPIQKEAYFRNMIKKVFKKFPPEKK
ncbi:DUF4136 domain-containing protein [Flavobacteriaceae bacterium R38]|nr:DUF4136 domain-containing protein [Flavobacteriaceae bacterium R38]